MIGSSWSFSHWTIGFSSSKANARSLKGWSLATPQSVSYTHLIPAVIGHHERYDGKGYPRRIAGEDIPLTARILCVADSFDAMTSVRCYKKAFPVKVAREKLIQDAGKQFDPELVRKFVECLDNGKITLVKAEEE